MVKRGDIILVDLDPSVGSEQAKTRPAIVIQHDTLNTYSNTTIIVPITSTMYDKNYPMHVHINTLKTPGTIKTEHIRAIDKTCIKKVIGSVSPKTLQEIQQALMYACDFNMALD